MKRYYVDTQLNHEIVAFENMLREHLSGQPSPYVANTSGIYVTQCLTCCCSRRHTLRYFVKEDPLISRFLSRIVSTVQLYSATVY